MSSASLPTIATINNDGRRIVHCGHLERKMKYLLVGASAVLSITGITTSEAQSTTQEGKHTERCGAF
jgi:hypothetical protein